MNRSLLKSITCSFLVLMGTLLSLAFGQSLPTGITPLAQWKAADPISYVQLGGPYYGIWTDAVSGYQLSSGATSQGALTAVNDGNGYLAQKLNYPMNSSFSPMTYTYQHLRPFTLPLQNEANVFIVMNKDYYRFSFSCQGGISISGNSPSETLYGVTGNMTTDGRMLISARGTQLPYSSSNGLSFSADKALIYEILVFDRLSDQERCRIEEYLLGKYAIARNTIPQSGLTLWAKANAGITADANGEISRIKDHSGYNHDLYTKYGSIKLNASAANGMPAFSWGTSYSNSTGNMIYNFNSNPDLVNGKAGEFFIVMNPKSNYYPTNYISRFSESGNQLIAKTALGSSYIYEGFGRNINDIAYATLPFSMYNNWTVYNVSVGGGIWESYLNSTLLRKDTNYQLSSNMAFYSFCIGFDMTSGGIYDVSSYRNPFEGSLAEVLVYNRKLTETERVQVRNYLMAKYGLQ